MFLRQADMMHGWFIRFKIMSANIVVMTLEVEIQMSLMQINKWLVYG
jgi:hypothetical protein